MNDTLHILWRLLKLFRPYWGWMVLGILISLVTLLANVSLLALSGWFITAMAIAGLTSAHMNYFTPSAAIRGFAIARIVSRYGERIITHEATFRLLAQLRRWFYEKLEPLSPAVLQTYKSGDLLSRIRADIDTLENFYLRIFLPMVVAILGCTAFLFFLYHYHPLLALTEGILLSLAGIFLPLIINKLSEKPGSQQIHTASELRSTVVDSVQGMGELLIYGAQHQQTERLSDLTEALLKDQQRMATYSGLSQAGLGLFANLAMWFLLLIAIPLVVESSLSPANLAMLVLFTLASFEAVMPLPLALQRLPETLAAARRVFDLADHSPRIPPPTTPAPQPHRFDIQFKQVDFRYSDDTPWILNNFNLTLPQHGKLGIVGSSGVGKSSIVSILLRFWPVQSGQVTLGGYPLEHFSGDALRRYFSVVSQRPHLFNSSIRANLLLANREASDEQLIHACQVAHIHDTIMALPDGYDSWIGEAGIKLSGGQAQRLAIARALLKEAPVVILDEAFEGLDSRLVQQLIPDLFAHLQEKTVIYITHKKAGLDKMDTILTL